MYLIPFIFIIPVSLLAILALGYFVLAKAHKKNEGCPCLKTVGVIIGWVLIAAATGLLITDIYFAANAKKMMSGMKCPMMQMMQQKQMMMKTMPQNEMMKNMPGCTGGKCKMGK